MQCARRILERSVTKQYSAGKQRQYLLFCKDRNSNNPHWSTRTAYCPLPLLLSSFSLFVVTNNVCFVTEQHALVFLHRLFIYLFIYVCMYVYVCMCMYVCMYLCMYVCMYVCMYICMYLCMYVCVCICMYICMCLCMYVYVCVYVCIYACVCVYVFLFSLIKHAPLHV